MPPRTEPLPATARTVLLNIPEQKRTRWQAARVRDYTRRVVTFAGAQPTVQISRVRDGRLVEGQETVEQLFDRLAAAFKTADDLFVIHDTALAFPATFELDPSCRLRETKCEGKSH